MTAIYLGRIKSTNGESISIPQDSIGLISTPLHGYAQYDVYSTEGENDTVRLTEVVETSRAYQCFTMKRSQFDEMIQNQSITDVFIE